MESPTPENSVLELAADDVRRVLERQKEERQILISQMNILFVTNTALLSFLTISKLLTLFSVFSVTELALFFLNFLLLIRALLPRQFAITPNPENVQIYLALTTEDYQLQMLANLIETYNINQKRVEDIAQSLTLATFVTSGIALVALLHQLSVYFIPELQKL
ncbi:hypothetical protein JYQ62_11040 [Nostoc sp. UHCC 0702]|nr:hypothetical protein JYQ62_11040 [Nostoc sp. UHCC 0702]